MKSMCSRLGVQQHVRSQWKANDTPPRGESLLAGTRNAYVNCGARTTARGRIGHACMCRARLARATRDVPTSRAREWRAARVARATCARSLRAQRGKRERAQWRSLLRATTRTTLTRTRARYANAAASRTLSQSARRILAPRAFSFTTCGAGDDASEPAALTSDRGALSRAPPPSR